jgi:hypothetical protein
VEELVYGYKPVALLLGNGAPDADANEEEAEDVDEEDEVVLPALQVLAPITKLPIWAGRTSKMTINNGKDWVSCLKLTGAINEAIDIWYTEERKTDVGASEIIVPRSLTGWVGSEEVKGRLGTWVGGKSGVRWEFKDLGWCVGVRSLGVECDIPDTWGGILRSTGEVGINNVLLGSGMSTDKCGKVTSRDGLVGKQSNECVGIRVNIRKKSVRGRSITILAADIGLDTGTKRAGYNSQCCAKLDKIGGTDTECRVLGENCSVCTDDLLHAVVLRAVQLIRAD